ncbi:DUF6891 domain-containing protein [Marinitenerispora sediminis]|uniref:DUF6891 domain-containing protein n=1 Tax=Marinitenerispora sediminis TaxID=1931232 RepID=A0A368TA82_9ACTN|nr:hypothetical protein [Marinitenerispora sediminis]RCV53388.1 hypothetical protein DEF28_10540 [Marinitenerispora sediminis]RCV58416.1 hypothetical protein DEF23_08830 [Marinitenerispora sediminis]RCV61803.1 hypothetical protein DEF24_03540 [Marinitenerispora sediminis]
MTPPSDEGTASAAATGTGHPLDSGVRERAARLAATHVAVGFMPRDNIAALLVERFGDGSPVDDGWAREIVDSLWEGEPDPAPADLPGWQRLARAFERLDDAGIVARGDFSCCLTCGSGEILDLAGPDTRGFVFYHMQDTEAGMYYGGLHLAFGDIAGTDDGTAAVGREVVEAVTAAGLPVSWDGTPRFRIEVGPRDLE